MKLSTRILSLVGTLSLISHVEGNMKLQARERMREDRAARERMLAGGSDSGMVFSRGYICIIKPQDFTFAVPTQFRNAEKDAVPLFNSFSSINLAGTSTFQSGGIYDPADVQIVDRLSGSSEDVTTVATAKVAGRYQFAGQRQPKFIPQADPGFFFNGECVAGKVNNRVSSILGHSCLLNLCLGGGGYNCLAIYAGSKFVFAPTAVSFDNFNKKNNIVPALPPSYPGTIIGGTGLFNGAVGYVDVTTITGSTATTNLKKGVLEYVQAGYITQKINVVSNIPLPVAP